MVFETQQSMASMLAGRNFRLNELPPGPKILPVGARGVVHTAQFNGKQESKPGLLKQSRAQATCAAPATVKQTAPQGATPFPSSHWAP